MATGHVAIEKTREIGTSMGGFSRRFAALAVVLLTLLLVPAISAIAQEDSGAQYPPDPTTVPVSTDPANVSRPAVRVAGSTQSLAFTGSSDTLQTVLVAGGLVIFGGALVFVASRRRGSSR